MTEAAATPEAAPVSDDAQFDKILSILGTPAEDAETTSDNDDAGDAAQTAPDESEDAQTDEAADDGEAKDEQPSDDKPAIDPATPVKVKVNGEEVEVPLEEALKGYSRLEDYKAKTAKLADTERSVKAEYADRLNQAVELFNNLDPVLSQAHNIDWTALAQQDPANFVALRQAYDTRIQTINNASAEIARARAEAQGQVLQRENEALLKAMPQLADPDEASKFSTDITQYLSKFGFTNQDIAEVADHRSFVVAHKAMLYDQMMAKQADIPNKKVAPKTAVKPLAPQASSERPRATLKKPDVNATTEEKLAFVLGRL